MQANSISSVVRGREAALARVQALSGLTFALFLGVHLVNVLLAPFGPALHDAVQGSLRAAYQAPPVELVVVLGALVVHVSTGVMRARRRQHAVRNQATRWQRRLGWGLVVIVFGHTLATRGPSLVYGVWPEFAGISFSLNWLPAWFYPYYLAFGLAAAFHGGLGVLRALRLLGWRPATPGRRGAALLLGALAVLLLVALLAYGGVLFPIADPMANDYAKLYLGP
ncbi:MAG: hypothetical protein H6711_04250 [Myxococcales bacterium]|nr:hypothetical protein [Myxococcales bacterium]